MPSLLDLRRRIGSIKNTQQITRAMKMVAAARLRRSQDRVLAARPYADELRRMVTNLSSRMGDRKHALLEEREEEKVLIVVVTGDKGLCGSFNTNVIRRASLEIQKHGEAELLLLGRRGADFFKRRPTPIRQSYTTLFTSVTFEQAEEIASDVTAAFMAHEYDAVYVVYNQFISVMQQKLIAERLLPLHGPEETHAASGGEYLLEPAPSDVLSRVVEGYVSSQVYRILLDSQAAEHAARMTAMDSATKNAGELIDSLTLTYNRSRQAAITKELIEVISGAKALEG